MGVGIILFAHGARDAEWSRPFEEIASALRALQPDAAVRLAYLEFMAPTMPEAAAALAAAGCTRIEVVPLFLGAGGHVRKDVPALFAQLQAAHPGVRFALHRAIGEEPSVIAAMAAAAAALLDDHSAFP
ncbi:MAG TPA: CbiX/SirB N-terminal domain-containing protein [Albitalea sp.]